MAGQGATRQVSVCIPTYEMRGLGAEFLAHSLRVLGTQTFTDFDVVVSDHSRTTEVRDVCDAFSERLDISYVSNGAKLGNSAANLNNAIRHAAGRLVKILFQDDFLFSETALAETVEAFDLSRDRWLVSACEHSHDGKTFYRPFQPEYNDQIHLGNNTISSPSVVTISNDRPLLFDENLVWLMDCDYYRRCHDAFGDPKILNRITVVNRTGGHQVTQTLATRKVRRRELEYVKRKYGCPQSRWSKVRASVSRRG
jgi:glycosyltransferase involved in cell wall biosynthesis